MHAILSTLLCICILFMRTATCASTSQSSSDPIIRRSVTMALTDFDDMLYSDDAHSTATLKLLKNVHDRSEILDLVDVCEVRVLSMFPTITMSSSESHCSPLHHALRTYSYKFALEIVSQFPYYTDVADSEGNMPLHCCIPGVIPSILRDQLQQLFMHQLNITNKKGLTPIFCTADPATILKFYMRGAVLDAKTIARIRPQIWKNIRVLGVLHHLGFDSKFLAATFYHPCALYSQWDYEQLAPEIRVARKEAHKAVVGSSSLGRALQMREQFCRTTRNELHRREQVAQAGREVRDELRLRTLLEQKKRERESDQSVYTKYMRRF